MAGAAVRADGDAARRLAALALALALAACGNQDPILPGERIPVRPDETPAASPSRARPVAIPGAVMNAEWPNRNGALPSRLVNPALRPVPQLIWSVDLGLGDAKRRRLLTAPIVVGRAGVRDRRRRAAHGGDARRGGRLGAQPGAGGAGARRGPGRRARGGRRACSTPRPASARSSRSIRAAAGPSGSGRWRRRSGTRRPCRAGGCSWCCATTPPTRSTRGSGGTLWRVQGAGGPGCSAAPARRRTASSRCCRSPRARCSGCWRATG